MVTKRRILKKDFQKIEQFVKDLHEERKSSPFRKSHEVIWREIDRQVAMEPMNRVSQDGKPVKQGWHNVFELGELSKASEIIAADTMRIIFPDDRTWFEPHVKLDAALDDEGRRQQDPNEQGIRDGVLRSLMAQQHLDFGFKARFKLSIKEALHHGSFVAEVRHEKEMKVEGGSGVEEIGAPVWVPYSMWNAYPDPSPAVHGTNLFYTGSMLLVEYMPTWKLKQMSGEGWMNERFDLIPKEEHRDKDNKVIRDVQLVKFLGDLVIERGDGDIFLPNSKVILANGIVVYWAPNDLPFPPVIFNGYERQDVRDPYYTSPLIKQSPMQKFTTIMANKFADSIELRVTPPIEYDGNDPDYVLNDGPDLSPGAKTPTRSMGKGFKALEIGDPAAALEGMSLGMRQLQEGNGVSSIRTGVTSSDRQTATEVRKVAQGAEVRTVDFVSVLEPGALRPFLYMQHMLNRKHLERYEFYNSEMHTPDWVIYSKSDVDHDAHFDIVGSKGLLGEEQRTERMGAVTAFASANPLFAPLLKPTEILLDMYRNAGEKSPEEFVQIGQPQIPAEVKAAIEQAKQMIAALQQELAKSQAALKDKGAELAQKEREMNAEQALERRKAALEHDEELRKIANDFRLGLAKIQEEARLEHIEMLSKERTEQDRIKAEMRPQLLEAVASIQPEVDGVKGVTVELRDLIGQLAAAVQALQTHVKNSRTRKITPTLNADGDVIGGEIETIGGDRYGVTYQ